MASREEWQRAGPHLSACLLTALLLLFASERASCRTVAGVANGEEKTADLTRLVNETLAINNRAPQQQQQQVVNFRDDWTFDRVEYDLMEFLQELNARYKRGPSDKNMSSAEEVTASASLAARSEPAGAPHATAATTASSGGQEATLETAASEPAAGQSSLPTATPAQVLPISLAGDEERDISESNWQYGIFDRFTRARSSTQAPHHNQGAGATPELAAGVLGTSYDVRSFNSDECGLRTYVSDDADTGVASFYPPSIEPAQAAGAADTSQADGTASKELDQRRQRPVQLAPSDQRRKQQQQQQQPAEQPQSAPDELDDDKQAAGAADQLANESCDSPAGCDSSAELGDGDKLAAESQTNADSEFNLSLRRQWLQQQLGNTLQMLGYNLSHQSSADFINRTSGISVDTRENMMKKSAIMVQKSHKALKQDALDHDEPALVAQLDELRARQDELKLEARVIGGTDARLGDSPWSVSLQALVARPGTSTVEYRHYCGGTIISEYFILTAAHCLDFMVGRESRLFVVMGDLNWRMSTSSMYGKRYGIEKLIIHSGYKSTAFGHDIGLIKTKEPIKPMRVNGRYIINSVCLPERNIEHSGEAELVGWGLFSNRNEMADSLQVADVPVLPRPLCVDLYKRRTGLIQWLIGIELITDKQICAGTFGRGICQGDSGSALVFNEKVSKQRQSQAAAPDGRASNARLKSNAARNQQQTRATIIGVVAFGGIRRCSYQSLPGVYMQTSKYLDWILPKISA